MRGNEAEELKKQFPIRCKIRQQIFGRRCNRTIFQEVSLEAAGLRSVVQHLIDLRDPRTTSTLTSLLTHLPIVRQHIGSLP